jgi:hypothetical protein
MALMLHEAARADVLWEAEEPERSLRLDTALKLTLLGTKAPDDPVLYPDRWTQSGLTRLRMNLTYRHGPSFRAEAAYEQRVALTSSSGRLSLPAGRPPYRLASLDWSIMANEPWTRWRHEIDRAFFTWQRGDTTLTLGRQAVGLGRGMLFSAVDLFAPFAPADIDREWRRGIDALRVEHRLSPASAIEMIAVGGRGWDDSALLLRAAGFKGEADWEVIAGKRARDFMAAAVVSAALGDSAVHGELALFRTPERQPDDSLFGSGHWVVKAVLGVSHTFDTGNGLTLMGEYHYSGFGVREAEDLWARLADPAFAERAVRGDFQITGRHGLAIQAVYPFTMNFSGTMLALCNPADGSGRFAPSVRWDFSRTGTLLASLQIPWGPSPDHGNPRSEYGTAPATLFLQANWYF